MEDWYILAEAKAGHTSCRGQNPVPDRMPLQAQRRRVHNIHYFVRNVKVAPFSCGLVHVRRGVGKDLGLVADHQLTAKAKGPFTLGRQSTTLACVPQVAL